MKLIPTDAALAERLARERGITIAGPDDPIYREGASITFITHSTSTPPVKPEPPQILQERFQTPMTFWVGGGKTLVMKGHRLSVGVRYAYEFFQDEPELCDALGIEVVGGSCPGSDYIAAEITKGVEVTNRLAKDQGLPFTFLPHKAWTWNSSRS